MVVDECVSAGRAFYAIEQKRENACLLYSGLEYGTNRSLGSWSANCHVKQAPEH